MSWESNYSTVIKDSWYPVDILDFLDHVPSRKLPLRKVLIPDGPEGLWGMSNLVMYFEKESDAVLFRALLENHN